MGEKEPTTDDAIENIDYTMDNLISQQEEIEEWNRKFHSSETNVQKGLIFFMIVLVIAGGIFSFVNLDIPIYFSQNGVCTAKHIATNGTCYVSIGHIEYSIDKDLYPGVLIGEGYDVSGQDGNIDDIQKYAEDSGL